MRIPTSFSNELIIIISLLSDASAKTLCEGWKYALRLVRHSFMQRRKPWRSRSAALCSFNVVR